MSHTTTYEQKVTDIMLFCKIAQELGHDVKTGKNLTVNHYGSNTEANCIAQVHIQGWRYPIAVKEDGSLLYDHWGSKANTMDLLGECMQGYHKELVMKNMDMSKVNNYSMNTEENGDVVIVMEM